ncbi:MAG TPA: S24 family peptidase [Shinella sp.]|jgi:phage repressor protein C with HTH and peptisase S24 domain|uniref:S24 family peptidase n=1 Tax=Shinella sp. TaxID=1870904 RepID=UPI002E14E549|nr:S24 family peptidase [Shinella sp.]
MTKMLISRINQRLQETGKAAQRVSIEATGAKETLRKILDGTTKNPRIDTLHKIARALDTSTEWLLAVDSLDELTQAPARGRTAIPPLPSRHEMPMDVPVMGTAAGSHLRGSFQLSTEPVDYVRRPPALMNARDIYALYIEGVSMIPQYSPGDLVYLNPHKPPHFGDPVIVQCKNGDGTYETSVGIYAKRTEKFIILDKHNPKAQVQILRDTIHAMHKILTLNELFGV